MAITEFVRRVQTARNVAYRYLQPGGGAAPRAGADWERLRAAAPLWLDAGIAADFDPAEFEFLAADARAELSTCVARYRAAAGDRPPADAEMTAGLNELGRVAELLGELVADPEGLGLLAVLLRDSGPLPPFVLGFDYNLDTDWSGDPAVWLWVLIPDDLDPGAPAFIDFTTGFRDAGWKAVKAAGSNRLPYIRYRIRSDALHPVSEDAA